jgi:hypothetical protein
MLNLERDHLVLTTNTVSGSGSESVSGLSFCASDCVNVKANAKYLQEILQIFDSINNREHSRPDLFFDFVAMSKASPNLAG